MKRIKTTVVLFLLMAGQAVAQAEYDTDRGFIHPGGLHTQEDFDRVKAQLESGNTKVKQAWQKLTASEYSQSGVQTYPTEIIVRGGGNGENYMNAARGAAMAYQNALRWKIAGTKANADAAVRILMQWARVTKGIGGDSNYALAAGLYGYQFAQAAELMRDYEGWAEEDFAEYKRWMLTVWYPSAIGFLRGRNGTWENADKWWQAPGHYWSNWGLCNALCVISIGILCDDVFIYNQGMSYIKYDQCGTFRDPRTEVPIKNDGLTEFMGNFVVTTYESELENGAYGLLGQLNESGRDAGHSSMSLGVMLDVAKVAWNQGGAAYTREISIHVRDNDRPTSGLLYYHDFETAPDGDGLLPDSLGFYPATLYGTAKRRFLDDGNWAVFTGSSKGYIDLGEAIGTDVMSQLKTNYTISLDLCVTTPNSLSNFCWAWAFSNGTSQYSALVNKSGGSNWYYEIKDGTAYQVNSNSSLTVNKWHTVTLVQKGTAATLYIDGVQKGTATISLKPTTFGYQLTDNWLGRSPFASDAYMTNTYIDNLRIYNTALTADEVQALADQRPTSKTVGDPTGIKDIEKGKWKMGNVAYNLQGCPLSLSSVSPVNSVLPKGIYIIDGKKVFIK